MNYDTYFRGSLFTEGFLDDSITDTPDWQDIDNETLVQFESELKGIFARFPAEHPPNETQTEDDLIWPILDRLGWTDFLRQQNLSERGRDDVPDGLLFGDDGAKKRANSLGAEWKRYEQGLAIVEAKRWLRPLDRRSGKPGEESAPSTQMLRYLRRLDDLTIGKNRWGILTNGAHWRLYYSGARLVSEDFFELNLAAILDIENYHEEKFFLKDDERRHWLKVLLLIFRRESFLTGAFDKQTFHQRAIAGSRFYQERVAASLSDIVFQRVFPDIVCAIAASAVDKPLHEVRDAALVLLYRLLFILYAEDRNLLPVHDSRYDDYALRNKVRDDIRRRKDANDVFSESAARYWSAFDDLCRAIDVGDESIGLPPYNGGLFDRQLTPLLDEIRLGDAVMADVIDALSFEQTEGGRHYINYRDLGVQQLGSIYERLLEREVIRDGAKVVVRPNIFARKDSGSYYTPDDLVSLVIEETLNPFIQQYKEAFDKAASEQESSRQPEYMRQGKLKLLDPAIKILELKVCDPAMGSGHFLVNLVDYLTDQVIACMAETEARWDGYISPLLARMDDIRNTIMGNAEKHNWTFDPTQLDDRHVIRRIILKRCIFGVDKNPMAVELAKVSLWLHTFTAGAPLSFLDHHLRCGDSLFGHWVSSGMTEALRNGRPLFLDNPLKKALESAESMQLIEGLADAEIAEAYKSARLFKKVTTDTSPLDAFLSVLFAIKWLNLRDRKDKSAYLAYLDGVFGNPIEIADTETLDPDLEETELGSQFARLFDSVMDLIEAERFLNWQVTFPGIWTDWDEAELKGGFDAVIANPPWDRMKLQQVEWFSARRPEIAKQTRAADRKRMITELDSAKDPLAGEFDLASNHIGAAMHIARTGGDYPLLSKGDLNLYSLFVERAMNLIKPDGMVGLLVPSGIASDKTRADFFKAVSTEGRLKALFDFENKKIFFSEVHASFKFCAFIASRASLPEPAQCGFFLRDVSEINDPDRCFPLSAEDFARVNPNTGTAPIFRTRRDAEITSEIYSRLPILVNHSSREPIRAWTVRYVTMFHMTNDSHLFRTRTELEEIEGAYPISGNRFNSPTGEWVPLYEGKMVQAYDHRAASVVLNPENLHRPAQSDPASQEQHQDPDWFPTPQYWVSANQPSLPDATWMLGFKDVTAPTNIRSVIAALLPSFVAGNTLPVLDPADNGKVNTVLLLANLNSIPLDYVARQKIHGQHLNWFVIEQLPVVSPDTYKEVNFGSQSAESLVREAVLELTYTAHDMAPFARDMGHVDDTTAEVLPPFRWDEQRRLNLRAKLDAIYFHLYGIEERKHINHVYSTFPIVEREETKIWGHYRSRDLCLAWLNALAAGNADACIDL